MTSRGFAALAESVGQDARFAVRTLTRSRAFAAVAVLTLALGIGANTAVFSAVNGILLRPLPYRDPSRLVALWPGHFASAAELAFLQRNARAFDGGAAAFSPGWGLGLAQPDAAVQLSGAETSANFFRILGARPLIGRTFADGESTIATSHVAILSHALWQTRFGSDSGVIGRSITLDARPYTVIGVMPADFSIFQQNVDLWLPLEVDPASPFYKAQHMLLLGRLRPGPSLAAATSEIRTLVPEIRSQLALPDDYGKDLTIVPLQQEIVGDLRPTLLVLLGAVGFIVLIAGANVGNLLLVRAGGRQREMAVRSALGAGRGRVISQLLIESLVLASAGGVAGVALGMVGVDALKRFLPRSIPRLAETTIDLRVLGVCAAVTIGIGVLFGLAPALLASRQDLQQSLRGGRPSDHGASGRRLRGSLVVAEVALALVLIVGAGLMSETLWRLLHVDAGFNADRVLTLRVQPSGQGFDTSAQRVAYFGRIEEAVRGVPGVEVVGGAQHLPLSGFDWHQNVEIEGQPQPAGATPFQPGWRTIDGDYLQAMGIRLTAGRAFTAQDDSAAPGVALVNATFAARMFPNGDAVGRRIRAGTRPWVTIVGVVHDVRHVSLSQPAQPEFYLSIRQFPQSQLTLVARTAGDPMLFARQILDRVGQVSRTVPISSVQSMGAVVSQSVAQSRAVMVLLLAFAVVGLTLGAVGIYGVVSYTVAGRMRDIGIRIALGARRAGVTAMIVREGAALGAAGVAIGVAASLALSKALQTLVFGVSATDVTTYASVAIGLIAVAVIASWLPARRAARADPVTTLRSD